MREDIKARVTSDKEEFERRLSWLNREMIRLPMEERRARWKEYFHRLDELSKVKRSD